MASITITGAAGRQIQVFTGLFIDNKFVPATNDASVDVENPTTGSFLARVSAAQVEDVNRAVASGKKASAAWRDTPVDIRRALLNRLADLIERDSTELASLEAIDAGLLYKDSFNMFLPQAVDTIRYYAGWADKIDGDSLILPSGMAYTRREPFGVCAAIVPWNAPLMISCWKLAPALATGNVIIIKTPELAPLYGQKLAQLVAEAGFPPGVVNILCGLGPIAGQRLAEHMDIRKVSFTGSNAVGRSILKAAAQSNLKKVTLELGGKGPNIIFSDAEVENALNWAIAGITLHNGQICAAGSRIYVQDAIYEEFVAEFTKRTKNAVAGDPLHEATNKGPVVSAAQKERIMAYIQKGREQKQSLLHGGGSSSLPPVGHFVENAAFINVDADAAIMRDEIFGPVASIARFKTEDEVIALANDSPFGLAAAVFTNDISKALRVSHAIECGQVTVNIWGVPNANAAFGGFKESGVGRDLGKEALDEWTQAKCVKINILPAKL